MNSTILELSDMIDDNHLPIRKCPEKIFDSISRHRSPVLIIADRETKAQELPVPLIVWDLNS